MDDEDAVDITDMAASSKLQHWTDHCFVHARSYPIRVPEVRRGSMYLIMCPILSIAESLGKVSQRTARQMITRKCVETAVERNATLRVCPGSDQ